MRLISSWTPCKPPRPFPRTHIRMRVTSCIHMQLVPDVQLLCGTMQGLQHRHQAH